MDIADLLHALSARRARAGAGLALLLGACSAAGTPPAAVAQDEAAPARTADLPATGDRTLLWGDTHVHSINSVDAFAGGSANADVDTAYRYARGMPVIFPKTGQKVQIDRPLDFIVVADHAENLGISARIAKGDAEILATPMGARLFDILKAQGARALTAAVMGLATPEADRPAHFAELTTARIRQTSWDQQIDAAERHNRPGTFTALIGWEWSSTPGMRNLHRVVITDADAATARQFLPFSYYMSSRPEDLWSFFETTRARTGADFVAIPHNSNLSDGRMFTLQDSDGAIFSAAYAARRAAWEPIVEISQYKGTSETHPGLSPRDEFADFELRNMLLTGEATAVSGGSYVRSALLAGLAEEQRTGANPFRVGLIAASDSHTGLASLREADFLGKLGEDFLPHERIGPRRQPTIFPNAEMSASGIAGVWADRNDRRSIFAAFRRREVYGTSGPRIALRLFAGHGFTRQDLLAKDFATIGYRKGVPMGGVLARRPGGAAPQFMIRAVKDPDAANLDRVQVVKGWVDAGGRLHETIHDVAWSGNRQRRADGTLEPVGNTVDTRTGRYRNSIGAAELTALWTDPAFDPARPAFYYVRVLEIPTPRQHLFDALALEVDPATLPQPMTIQERAWSSPVWYRP